MSAATILLADDDAGTRRGRDVHVLCWNTHQAVANAAAGKQRFVPFVTEAFDDPDRGFPKLRL